MSNKLLDFFEQDLNTLRGHADKFSRENVSAQHVNFSQTVGGDVFNDGVLQSVAFLSAKVRHQLNSEYAFFSHALLDVLYPHFRLPIPAMGMVAVSPKAMTQKQCLPRNTPLLHAHTSCRFKTAFDINLYPLKVTAIQLDDSMHLSPDIKACLDVELKAMHQALRIDDVSFYINLPDSQAMMLYEAMFNHLLSIEVLVGCEKKWVQTLSAECLLPVGFDENQSLLPLPEASFSGYGLLSEYFAFANKFMCFKLLMNNFQCQEPVMTLRFCFHGDLDKISPFLTKESLLINCVPIINLFDQVGESVSLDYQQAEYHLPSTIPNTQIYQVIAIEACSQEADAIACAPFYAMSSSGQADVQWSVNRKPCAELDGGAGIGDEVFLSVNVADDRIKHKENIILSPQLICMNRKLPEQISRKSVALELYNATHLLIDGIETVTPIQPPIYDDSDVSKFDLINHIVCNQQGLSGHGDGVETLKRTLSLYEKMCGQRGVTIADGLLSLDARNVVRRVKQDSQLCFCHGVDYQLTVNEAGFPHHNAFLLGCVLNQFLTRSCAINSFVQLTLISQQRGVIKQWKPSVGKQRLL